MARRVLTVEPPLAGEQRQTAFQAKPPFSCYASVNMWPLDYLTGRSVYATRPPFEQLAGVPSGFNTSLIPINGVVTDQPEQSFLAAYDGDLYWWNGTGFTAATGAQADEAPTTRAGYGASYLLESFLCVDSAKPIVFDYSDGTAATLSETAGTCPSDTRFAIVWQGALWLFGALANPHIMYASRIGDAHDYDFSVSTDDLGRAFQSTSSDTFGRLNGPVTAAAALTDDAMMVSTLGGGIGLVLRHPNLGGIYVPRSEKLFVLGQGAWCKAPDDTIYMLTPQGIATLAPNPNAVPALLSKTVIPEELIGLTYDYANPVVSMAYDSRWNGISICVRGAEQQAWWYDLNLGGFHRMEMTSYPYVLMEHLPFVTQSTSGLLYGGSSTFYMDKFGETETILSSVVFNPVKISTDNSASARLQRANFVFGRDTPKGGGGSVAIATGTDGQDAVNRLLIGSHQYETDFDSLSANFGRCTPLINGHAMAMSMSQGGGTLSIEMASLEVEDAGRNRGIRSDQIAVEGDPVDFTAPGNDFDSDEWQGYSGATPATPNCILTSHTHFVDLSLLPASWWAVVATNGGDIRATDDNNNQLPIDLIEFDKSANTGFLTLSLTQQDPPTPVRLWVGNPGTGLEAASSTYGQYNAYDDNWIAFWPSGGGADRTVNVNALTMTGATDGDSTGPIGNLATDYGGNVNWYGVASAAVPSSYPLTIVTAARREDATTTLRGALGLHKAAASPTTNQFLSPHRAGSNPNGAQTQITSTNTSPQSVLSDQGATPYQWLHYAATVPGAAERSAFISGGGKQTDTDSIATTTLDEIVIGKGSRSALSSNSFQGLMSLSQVHDTERSDCWIDYQAQMMDQPTFWGSWGEFEEVNPPDDPDDPGGGSPVETGSWSGFAYATPITPSGTNQPDWVHWIDLSDMPTEWWSAVDSTGVDIRATDEEDRFIPFDLIEFGYAANTGFATVRLSQNITAGAMIKLWVGNGSAIAVSADSIYGQYAVYDTNWVGFWPSGGGTDRTRNGADLTMGGSPTVGGATGPGIGIGATSYDGSQYGYATVTAASQYPLTLAAVYQTASYHSGAMLGLTSVNNSLFYLYYAALGLYPYTASSNLEARSYNGTTHTFSDVTEDLGSYHHVFGFIASSTIRGISVDGNTITEATPSPVRFHDLNRVVVGNILTGKENDPGLWRPFIGDLCLLSVHNTIRALDEDWAAYQKAMLNQGTFYPDGWVWTAEVSSLPQN